MVNFSKQDFSLKNYNTFGIECEAKYLFEPTSFSELKEGINYFNEQNLKYFVLGNGSNIILPDNYFDGVIVILKKLNKIEINNNSLTVSAGVMLPFLSRTLLKEGYTNFWWASNIPGTVGASIYGNAGALNNDMFTDLIEVTILKDNKFQTLKKEDILYEYRQTNIDGIVVEAKYNLFKENLEETLLKIKEFNEKRINTQPIEFKNAGSTFRNPLNNYAGKLIEEIGYKERVEGGAMVSSKHANFIINFNNATSKDVIKLIEDIKQKVKTNYNIDLVLENKIIKWEEL